MANLDMPARSRISPQAAAYRAALQGLRERSAPFLVGGTYAFTHYTEIARPTKDLDLFVCRRDRDRVLADLESLGWRTHVAFEHWLAKAERDDRVIDVIHGAGNGVAMVDDEWFAHAQPALVLGLPVQLIPPEEMVWSKAFVMEKYRFDGADVAHMFLRQGRRLDWERLVRRFGPDARVLLAHLVLFEYIYPSAHAVPDDLALRLAQHVFERDPDPAERLLCRGVLLSRKQYRIDTDRWGLRDARLGPDGSLSAAEIAEWNAADPPPPGPDAESEL